MTKLIDDYIQETTFRRLLRSTSRGSSVSRCPSPAVARFHENISDTLGDEINELVYQIFSHIASGESWSSQTCDVYNKLADNMPVVELITAKFDHCMILRCDNESIFVINDDTVLIQCRQATTTQKLLLDELLPLFNWTWAYTEYGVVPTPHLKLRNRNNDSVAYNLKSPLRIEIPSTTRQLFRRVRHAQRRTVPALALAQIRSDNIENEPLMRQKSRPTRRRTRRGRVESPRELLAQIHRNSLMPSPERLARQLEAEKQRQRKAQRSATAAAAAKKQKKTRYNLYRLS
mmetsp:Transcript_7097/g.12445  ORF Transcript_7097/g.12445 Transcript_7097/m.12445 type:complete len:289 (-) Transcript_7097:53-919(-)|eukprot:CAMPEP_0168579576 /NCGR_PEP_ID=MMETSP0420-20121227/303_1 /TAXON_ID=498008 /ORGANISM="Pessonella sp." /LENGTH=288 /DNA_ID=CAMNT_0008613567 /DNA_START=132 /DNA_END=998 /DNA_ORIENTATION=+